MIHHFKMSAIGKFIFAGPVSFIRYQIPIDLDDMYSYIAKSIRQQQYKRSKILVRMIHEASDYLGAGVTVKIQTRNLHICMRLAAGGATYYIYNTYAHHAQQRAPDIYTYGVYHPSINISSACKIYIEPATVSDCQSDF